VDSHLAIKESSEKNNKVGKSYTAVVTKLADLVVSHLSVAPNPATLQQQVTATVRVKNQGNLAAGAFTVGFWRDGHVGNPDHEWQVAGLAAGAETADLTFQFTLNDQAPGAQHVAWAEADRAKQVPESNENNNTLTYNYKSQTEGQAELLCSDMAVQPDPVGLGGTVTITVKVLNQGGKAAGAFQIAAWKNRASPSPPTDDTGSDHLWNVAGLDPLAETPYLTWDYPAASAGAFTCWVLADCKLMVPESNENNNYASDSYTIIGPDCIVSFLQVTPDPSTLGDQLTVSVRGKNIGNAAIPVATCPKISFWRNLTTPPTNDAGEDHSWTFCGLAVNQETQTFTWNFTPAAAGNYDAWALIDSTDIVHELDETNNTKDDLYAVNNP
jgi:subtilase family serine protease